MSNENLGMKPILRITLKLIILSFILIINKDLIKKQEIFISPEISFILKI